MPYDDRLEGSGLVYDPWVLPIDDLPANEAEDEGDLPTPVSDDDLPDLPAAADDDNLPELGAADDLPDDLPDDKNCDTFDPEEAGRR